MRQIAGLLILFGQIKSMRYVSKLNFYVNNILRCLVVFLGLLALSPLAEAAKQTTATAIEVVLKDDTTRFFAELTAETSFSATVLAEPYRVIIDMENVSFDLPPGAGRKANGLIRQVRYIRPSVVA